jgi:DNA-directed RNA polymerase specialized sigma24 family protein
MADRIKQPLGTVKTWCRTALLKLREELGEAVAV